MTLDDMYTKEEAATPFGLPNILIFGGVYDIY